VNLMEVEVGSRLSHSAYRGFRAASICLPAGRVVAYRGKKRIKNALSLALIGSGSAESVEEAS
jgi:hypothetical protein